MLIILEQTKKIIQLLGIPLYISNVNIWINFITFKKKIITIKPIQGPIHLLL